jgi:hypothetical protein
MNTIFNGSYTHGDLVYDYSGVWVRRSGGIDWKAVVRNADVVCRPSGTIDDEINDREAVSVIKRLVEDDIQTALAEREAKGAVASRQSRGGVGGA